LFSIPRSILRDVPRNVTCGSPCGVPRGIPFGVPRGVSHSNPHCSPTESLTEFLILLIRARDALQHSQKRSATVDCVRFSHKNPEWSTKACDSFSADVRKASLKD